MLFWKGTTNGLYNKSSMCMKAIEITCEDCKTVIGH